MYNLADLFAEIWRALDCRLEDLRKFDDDDMTARIVRLQGEFANLIANTPEGAAELHVRASDDLVALVAAAQVIDGWYAPLSLDGEISAEL